MEAGLRTEQRGNLHDGCVGRLLPNYEGYMSQDDATLKAGHQTKPPHGQLGHLIRGS